MAEIQMKKGTMLFQKESPLTSICVILDGQVEVRLADRAIILETGDVLGLIDLATMIHSYDQVALTDLVVDSYPVRQPEELKKRIAEDEDFANQLTMSMLHLSRHILTILDDEVGECDKLFSMLMQMHTDYLKYCDEFQIAPKILPGINQIPPLSLSNRPAEYSSDYYKQLSEICFDINYRSLFGYSGFVYGVIMQGCQDIRDYLVSYQEAFEYQAELASYIMRDDHLDLVDLYSAIRAKINRPDIDPSGLHNTIGNIFHIAVSLPVISGELCEQRLEEYDLLLRELARELENDPAVIEAENNRIMALVQNSFETILDYAGFPLNQRLKAHEILDAYKNYENKMSDEDDVKELRASLTQLFLNIYEKSFLVSMQKNAKTDIPIPVSLFWRYGFLDETLCGKENTIALYKDFTSEDAFVAENVHYFYDWLSLIYHGQKEPGRNMLDQTYPVYVETLVTNGEITKDEKEFMLQDMVEQIRFELSNLFLNGLKMTYGRLSTFCPALSEHDMLKNPKNSLLTKKKVLATLDDLLSVDFSAFYRDTLYYDKEHGIHQEIVQKEILPDIILLPNVGTRGVLWQETQGANRSTPGCMVLPVQCLSDIKLVLLRLTGEFRWEMCKRVQGARWNDVTSPSLTSEYFDYLQFYKKNNDLSSEAKEKCKLQLQRTKNRYRENFLLDYASWIMYETKGLPKLNKVSRKILMRYCPPAKELRDHLAGNPLYENLITQYENRREKEVNRIDRLIYRVQKNYGSAVPKTLLEQAEFFKK